MCKHLAHARRCTTLSGYLPYSGAPSAYTPSLSLVALEAIRGAWSCDDVPRIAPFQPYGTDKTIGKRIRRNLGCIRRFALKANMPTIRMHCRILVSLQLARSNACNQFRRPISACLHTLYRSGRSGSASPRLIECQQSSGSTHAQVCGVSDPQTTHSARLTSCSCSHATAGNASRSVAATSLGHKCVGNGPVTSRKERSTIDTSPANRATQARHEGLVYEHDVTHFKLIIVLARPAKRI